MLAFAEPHAVVRPKLVVGSSHDADEQEADRAAALAVDAGAPTVRRACACGGGCPRCRGAQGGGVAPPVVHQALASPGEPLDAATRAFMEPRLGADLGGVRVHTGPLAARSAAAVSAQAYTVGRDVVFGAGRYAPATPGGRRLLAHELAHVAQGGPGLRRMTLGTGTPPQEDWRVVPEKEQGRALAAIARVRKIAKDPKGHATCHAMYARECAQGGKSALESAFDSAVLWRKAPGVDTGAGATTRCEGPDAAGKFDNRNVSYTDTGYAAGEVSLAFNLLHELGHVCGINCPKGSHYTADRLTLECMGPRERAADQQLLLSGGISTEDVALVASYGWLLKESRSGRLGLRLNTSVNLMGALRALGQAAGEDSAAGEIGGATLDLRMRPFGAERFGGLSFHVGAGGQLGRFVVRPPTADDPADIRYDAAVVVEVGGRIEWWVKDEEKTTASGEVGRVKPRAVDFSWRMVQPATTGARRVHEFILGWTTHF